MSKFKNFMKANQIKREDVTHAPTKWLRDENGDPVKFTLRPLTTEVHEEIRESCTVEVPIPGKYNMYRTKLNSGKYLTKMLVRSIVYPDLNNKELQDSYGVMSPEDLIKQMIVDPGEYQDFASFVQEFNGFKLDFEETVKEAKN